jgi:hypothetical protein
MMSGSPRRISGSPPVNRTSVTPRCRTATEISRTISSSVSRAAVPGGRDSLGITVNGRLASDCARVVLLAEAHDGCQGFVDTPLLV